MTDIILVGGGLANSLIALWLHRFRPELKFIILESQSTLGGNHTWSFHTSDVSYENLETLTPLISYSWPTYEVHFQGHSRLFQSGYHSLTSDKLHRILTGLLSDRIHLNCEVSEIAPHAITLKNGQTLQGQCIIDGRGTPAPKAEAEHSKNEAYQKFYGQDLEFDSPHGLTHPMLMDARIDQNQGFHFLYALPWSSTSLLLEDTYYSKSPGLDISLSKNEIAKYCHNKQWKIKTILREEYGCLPIPLRHAPLSGQRSEKQSKVALSGARGGFSHPTTGYTLGYAVALAQTLASHAEITTVSVKKLFEEKQHEMHEKDAFFRFMNRMLFEAAEEKNQAEILRAFYELPQPLIERFYRGSITPWDRLKILNTRPPVSKVKALACFLELQRSTTL